MTREELQKLRVKLNAAKADSKDLHGHTVDDDEHAFTNDTTASALDRLCEVVDALLDEAAK